MCYPQQRFCENQNKIVFDGVGEYDIPIILPEEYVPCEWIGFNYARGLSTQIHPDKGVHFFLDDYQFERLWREPDKYIRKLINFNAVMTPGFSIFADWPKALQIYNHFRKHWIGAYLQNIGATVYPTIGWSDEASYEWCFDGEPVGATACVSSIGTQNSSAKKKLFLKGYDSMLEHLRPTTTLFYGNVPSECKGNIVPIQSFANSFKKGRNGND